MGTKADVIFAFFGYNESFAGEAGLATFKPTSTGYHQAHAEPEVQRPRRAAAWCCSRRSRMRICTGPNLPDGTANNDRLKLYTAAMAEVAKANDVTFVDLFEPTLGAVTQQPTSRCTINGIHLNEEGNRRLAEIIDATSVRRVGGVPHDRQAWSRSARRSSTRTFTGSIAIAPSTATRSTAAGPI